MSLIKKLLAVVMSIVMIVTMVSFSFTALASSEKSNIRPSYMLEAEEAYVREFAEVFKQTYISPKSSDYTKVKAIYDFVVRNCEYDTELFENKDHIYSNDCDRFRIAHSAYGALVGNKLTYQANKADLAIPVEGDASTSKYEDIDINIKFNNDYGQDAEVQQLYIEKLVERDFDSTMHGYFVPKETVTHEKVVKLKNSVENGRAVCEGYSELFGILCEVCGITSEIVTGDYVEYVAGDDAESNPFGDLKSGKASDPHEWNTVYLDDGTGSKWYLVDTTFASQKSIKELDQNNYDYFLSGTMYYAGEEKTPNYAFSYKNHQQPYIEDGPIPQVHDWYSDEYKFSEIDYNIPLVDLSTLYLTDTSEVIIQRVTAYDDGVKSAFLYQTANGSISVHLNDEEKLGATVDGFDYNGKLSAKYYLIIPYLIDGQYEAIPLTNIKNAGQYTIAARGYNNTSFEVNFRIAPIDMDKNSSKYSESDIEIVTNASYTGNQIIPYASIKDGYGNHLVEKTDYTLEIYQNGKPTVLKEMGQYEIRIVYKGNYKGIYSFEYTVGKINLNQINFDEYSLPYIPEYFRKQENLYTAADFFKSVSNLKIGTIVLVNGVNGDFTVESSGSIGSYGDTGTMNIVANKNSPKVQAGTYKQGTYRVNEKFDISNSTSKTNGFDFNSRYADSNSISSHKLYYDGTAKKPTELDNLEKMLDKTKDYKIVGYSNNINAGTAKVTIEGINGCTGSATMYFLINPATITTADVTPVMNNGVLTSKVVWNGKTLKKGVDYKETIETSVNENTNIISITGIGNYNGTKKVGVAITFGRIPFSSSNNKIKLSQTKYTYTGKAIKPSVKITNASGKTVDPYFYTVKYSNNTNVGTATATITLRNGFSGTFKATYTIVPKSTTISSLTAASKGFTVKWKKQATQTTGYEIQIATNSKFTSGVKNYAVTKNSTVSKKITKLTAKKKYYARIRTYKTVSGKKYYSDYSTAKYVTTKK